MNNAIQDAAEQLSITSVIPLSTGEHKLLKSLDFRSINQEDLRGGILSYIIIPSDALSAKMRQAGAKVKENDTHISNALNADTTFTFSDYTSIVNSKVCLVEGYRDSKNQIKQYHPALRVMLGKDHQTFFEYQVAVTLADLNWTLLQHHDKKEYGKPGPALLVWFFHSWMNYCFSMQVMTQTPVPPSPLT